eukprot:scaffold1355_cov268-Pinguiococcus_pyrenoidosus.AAC.70
MGSAGPSVASSSMETSAAMPRRACLSSLTPELKSKAAAWLLDGELDSRRRSALVALSTPRDLSLALIA